MNPVTYDAFKVGFADMPTLGGVMIDFRRYAITSASLPPDTEEVRALLLSKHQHEFPSSHGPLQLGDGLTMPAEPPVDVVHHEAHAMEGRD